MYETIFDIPGYWEMNDYGDAVAITHSYGAIYFYSLQPWYQYHY